MHVTEALGPTKLVSILQMTIANAFCWQTICQLQFKCQWSLFLWVLLTMVFPWVQLTMIQHWFSNDMSSNSSLITRFMGQTWGNLGPTGPRWAPCWPHEPCYLGCQPSHVPKMTQLTHWAGSLPTCSKSIEELWILNLCFGWFARSQSVLPDQFLSP